MATFENGETSIYYEEHGAGFPLLLIAPGGMRSAIPYWDNAPWNPIEAFAGSYRVIAMDQRNARRSTGPVAAADGWETFAADQLALMDHLGCKRFHVMGMCIGGSYIFGLIKAAPERVASAVIAQSIGLHDNRQAFYDMYDSWANELKPDRPDVSEADWAGLRSHLYDGDFLFSVDRDFVSGCTTPLLVLCGRDLYHPEETSRDIARLAANATLVEHWKEGEHLDAGRVQVDRFLASNTPGGNA